MNCRRNVKDLLPAEKAAFVQALIDLKHAPSQVAAAQTAGGQGRYDDFVWIHDQVRGAAHNAPAFTPWHREFLYQLERELQAVSGNPQLTIPYWDWTKARAPSDPGWPFTDDFLGGLGTSAGDSRVTTGRFATDPAHPSATEWRINVPDVETGDYLKRRGIPPEFNLPSLSQAQAAMAIATYDASPWVITGSPTTAQLNASFRKFLEFVLHNGPHPWVGLLPQFSLVGALTNAPLVGSMSWQASPNDPAFWLHHCNIDRLWALWQQRQGYPGYLPQSGGPALENGPETMGMYSDPSFFNYPQHATPNSNEIHRSLGYIYASDVPEVPGPLSPSLDFGDVPEGLTTYRPVQFSVTSCQPVKFRITAVGGAGYADPYPGAHTATPAGDVSFTADVYVAFHAPIGGSGAVAGSVTIEAFFEDPDRLYVPIGAASDESVIGSWTISLTATVVPRPRAAIALALDRSGSMSLPAGGGLRRFDLLESAVDVVSDLMRDTDAMGLVYYDQNVIRRMNMTPMTAAGGKAQVAAALADPALEPAGGMTAIGKGMIEAADVITDEMGLPGTPYARFAMLVMTDGNENVTPYADDPMVTSAISPFSSQVYAVGLGREGEVSDATLGAIANYMLVTGDMDADEREFRLTKYFVQILAGVTNMAIITDPAGHLTFGVKHRIPFDLTSADLNADVIVLSPLAFLVDLELEAPDGTVLTEATAGLNGGFHRHRRDDFYRLGLPALPARANGTHAGRWTAVLSLDPARVKESARRLENLPTLLDKVREGSVPYTLTVHTWSNVSFDVRVEQDTLLTGAKLHLDASLRQYQAPLGHRARVRVEIAGPGGDVSHVELAEFEPGRFHGQYQTTLTGIYRCRFLASGRTLEAEDFTREQTRTAAVYRRLPVPATPVNGDGRDTLCDVFECLIGDAGIRELLARHKVDVERLRRCIGAACGGARRDPTRGLTIMKKAIEERLSPGPERAEIEQGLSLLLRPTGSAGILETPEPVPVKAPPPQNIPMNPLGGMWPVVEKAGGDFEILLKTEDGQLDPPPESWRKDEDRTGERRKPMLAASLVKRIEEVAAKGGRRKSK